MSIFTLRFLLCQITSCGLANEMPTELGLLTSLTVLDLSSNTFKKSIPDELQNLQALTVLNLGHTLSHPYPRPFPSWLAQFPLLVQLDVTAVGLSGPLPSTFASQSLLKVLRMSANSLTGGVPDSYALMSNLLSIELGANRYHPVPFN